jgi:hypothetical protein
MGCQKRKLKYEDSIKTRSTIPACCGTNFTGSKKGDTVKFTLYNVLTDSSQQVHLYEGDYGYDIRLHRLPVYIQYKWNTGCYTQALTFNGNWTLTTTSDTRLNIQFAGTEV